MPINERGRVQARELARTFAGFRFRLRLHEPVEQGAAKPRKSSLRCCDCRRRSRHDGLKERNFGVIQGIPKAELAELNPSLLEHIVKRNPDTRFEQGESMDECATRVLDGVQGHRAAETRRARPRGHPWLGHGRA